jgi:hypothetical protein
VILVPRGERNAQNAWHEEARGWTARLAAAASFASYLNLRTYVSSALDQPLVSVVASECLVWSTLASHEADRQELQDVVPLGNWEPSCATFSPAW